MKVHSLFKNKSAAAYSFYDEQIIFLIEVGQYNVENIASSATIFVDDLSSDKKNLHPIKPFTSNFNISPSSRQEKNLDMSQLFSIHSPTLSLFQKGRSGHLNLRGNIFVGHYFRRP